MTSSSAAKFPVTKPRRPRGRPKVEGLAERRRAQILDVAAEVFAQHGYRNADVQTVADALALGKGTIYRYFPSKEALFLAAVDRGMRRLREAVHPTTIVAAKPLDRIRLGIRAYLSFFREHPQYVELLIQERAEFRDRKKSTYFVHRDASREEWVDVLRELIEAGQLRDLPVDRIIDVVGDLVYGTMFTNHFAAGKKPPATQEEDILDIIWHGILSDNERKRRLGSRDARIRR